jgi:hypothetical protein
MKLSSFVIPVSPALISLAPGKRPIPQRLEITVWQTHFWTKKIIKLRKLSKTQGATQIKRRKGKTPSLL